ncbi:MAG: succinate dehydrogenase, hydrophobic membrane anchor protein [Pseudomonadota bacterium]
MAIKRIVVGAHYGLRDWLLQRVTAVVMALYTLVFLVMFVVNNPQGYEGWHALFAIPFFKGFTFITLLSLFYHAWIGMRDIWMDYIKPVAVRLVLHCITALLLIVYAGWAVKILWGVN